RLLFGLSAIAACLAALFIFERMLPGYLCPPLCIEQSGRQKPSIVAVLVLDGERAATSLKLFNAPDEGLVGRMFLWLSDDPGPSERTFLQKSVNDLRSAAAAEGRSLIALLSLRLADGTLSRIALLANPDLEFRGVGGGASESAGDSVFHRAKPEAVSLLERTT